MKLLLRVCINNWGKLHHRLDLSTYEIQNSSLNVEVQDMLTNENAVTAPRTMNSVIQLYKVEL